MILFIYEFKNYIMKILIYKCYQFLVIILKKQIRTPTLGSELKFR